MFDASYFGFGFEAMEFPDWTIIAGDMLTLKYTGEIRTKEIFPGEHTIYNGELKSWKFDQTYIIEEHDKTIEQLKEQYNIFQNYIITDQIGHYESLDSYSGSTFYLAVNLKAETEHNEHSSRSPIAGVYSFNPRPLS